MTCVSNYMDITWICKHCGAVNTTDNDVCTGCSTAYASSGPRESVTNQALLNQGVIFNNAVFAPQPQPTLDDMMKSTEACYPIEYQTQELGMERPQESFGMRVFTWTANILMWLSILIAGSIFLFFVVIVIMALGSI